MIVDALIVALRFPYPLGLFFELVLLSMDLFDFGVYFKSELDPRLVIDRRTNSKAPYWP